jgi:hypothetical protein
MMRQIPAREPGIDAASTPPREHFRANPLALQQPADRR